MEGGSPSEARVLFQDKGSDPPPNPSTPTAQAAAWSQSRQDSYNSNFPPVSPYKDARQKEVKGGGDTSIGPTGFAFSAYAKKPLGSPPNITPFHFGASSTPSTSIDSSLTSSVYSGTLKASSYKGVPHIQKKISPICAEEQETMKKTVHPWQCPSSKRVDRPLCT